MINWQLQKNIHIMEIHVRETVFSRGLLEFSSVFDCRLNGRGKIQDLRNFSLNILVIRVLNIGTLKLGIIISNSKKRKMRTDFLIVFSYKKLSLKKSRCSAFQ